MTAHSKSDTVEITFVLFDGEPSYVNINGQSLSVLNKKQKGVLEVRDIQTITSVVDKNLLKFLVENDCSN